MRTAILALFVSVGLLAALAVGSFFGHPFLPERFQAKVEQQPAAPVQAGQYGRPVQPVQVPAGFQGPTGQPSVKGPSGPPPEE
jgi:hypothetical protein